MILWHRSVYFSSMLISAAPDLSQLHQIPLVMENKSKNRVLAASAPRISIPAECGPLERFEATEDPFGPSSGSFLWLLAESGSPLCRLLLWHPSTSPAKLANPRFLVSLLALRPDLHLPPRTPCAHPTQLQPRRRLGRVSKPWQGLGPASWQNLLAPSRPRQVLKSCVERRVQKEERKQPTVFSSFHLLTLCFSRWPSFQKVCSTTA